MARLRFYSGPRTGQEIELKKAKTVFGRHDSCDYVLPHPIVSRRHFSLERVHAKHLLVDEKSGNGTFLNGESISWCELKDGDVIKAGPFELIFEIGDTAEPQPLASDNRGSNDSDLDRPREFLAGIEHFNEARYYEAHEVWEEIWLRSTGDAKLFYQMLIQAAVGLLHFERKNVKGARGMYDNVICKLAKLPPSYMSVDIVDFGRQFRQFLAPLIEGSSEPSSEGARPRIQLHSEGEKR